MKIIFKNKYNFWHRLNGPAYISRNEIIKYLKYDVIHRENGPAIIHKFSAYKAWYLNGKRYNIKEYYKEIKNKNSK